MAVKKGDKIKVEYEGKFEDGTVFDSSKVHGNPLEFVVGSRMVVKGFDDAVIGMNKDGEKEFTLKPAEAYGERRDELQQKVPREKLPALPPGQELKVGMVLMVGTPDGQQMPVNITEVNDKEITIDLNHPLAGKTLIFKIKVLDISSGGEDEKNEKDAKKDVDNDVKGNVEKNGSKS